MSTITEIDLQPFCEEASDKVPRYAIEKPFVIGERRYGTDVKVAISVPAPGEPDSVSDRKYPRMADVFKNWNECRVWQPWPASNPVIGNVTCPKCKGNGAAHSRECDECDGHGGTICDHCDSEIECKECEGEGTVLCGKCPKCDGQKLVNAPKYQLVGELAVAVKYDAAIRELPAVQFSTTKAMGGAVLLRFAGDGRGVVMPLVIDGAQ